jgi:hypothetical protein
MHLLRDSALKETVGVSWATLRGQQFVLAQGSGQITVLESVIKFEYREMTTEVSPETAILYRNSKERKTKCVFCCHLAVSKFCHMLITFVEGAF